MDIFIKALLAKQGWRILSYPNSLMARVLKAKYFASSSFLAVNIGHNPSYIWRSILWGGEVILFKGLDGKLVMGRITESSMIRGSPIRPLFKPITKLPAGLDVLLVSDLIANGAWDRDEVMSYFWEVDREAIFSIPLGVRVRSDMMLWHYEDNSCYTVRSGYKVAMDSQILESCAENGVEGKW